MAVIHLVGGERGGVGKSMLSRALAGYLITRKIDFALFDGDDKTRDIYQTYKDSEVVNCRIAYYAGGEKHDEASNAIFNSGLEKLTLVNLPANNLRAFSDWYEKERIAYWGKQSGLRFIQWFVSDGSNLSFVHLQDSLNCLGETIPHVLVKNLHKCTNWEVLKPETNLSHLLERYGVERMNMPEFGGSSTLPQLINGYVRFEDFIADEGIGAFERIRARNFLEPCWDAFDALGVFINGD